MYQEDGLTSVGYMKNFDHVNNSRLGRDKTVLAFNPIDSGVPSIQLIDRDCQDFNTLRLKYRTLVQSIRMISCHQRNVWTQQPQKWSTVAIGLDQEGRVLFLFCQAPRSVHDFVEILLSLPISIRNAMYLEGGPQASLYLSSNGVELAESGDGESAFAGNESVLFAWPIPNVIGIVKKPATLRRELYDLRWVTAQMDAPNPPYRRSSNPPNPLAKGGGGRDFHGARQADDRFQAGKPAGGQEESGTDSR